MNKRALTHYLLSSAILALYGSQVCPFLESLPSMTLLGIMLSGFLVAYGIRHLLYSGSLHQDLLEGLSGRYFKVDFLLFVAVGVVLTIYNFIHYRFPLLSGMKLMVGCVTLGFFCCG